MDITGTSRPPPAVNREGIDGFVFVQA